MYSGHIHYFAQCIVFEMLLLESSNIVSRHGCAMLQHFRYSSGALGGSVDSREDCVSLVPSSYIHSNFEMEMKTGYRVRTMCG